jgi:hypothetical protein
MTVGTLGGGVVATAERAGAAAVAAASARLAARLAIEAPEITVTVRDGEVRLVAPGLVPRAFGSRRRGPDPRLLVLVGGGA